MTPRPSLPAAARRQAGFTIVEMMVGLAIGLFISIGFATTFVSMKTSFNSQDKLAQLQDNERLAMTILSGSVQQAGYYPSPLGTGSAAIVASADSDFGAMSASQALTGNDSSSKGVSLSTAYASSGSGDGLLDCLGESLSSGASVRNIFFVDSATQTLQCQVELNGVTTSPTKATLVSGVSSMTVLYGVGNPNVTGYYSAANVSDWSTVRAVRITLNFVDPNDTTHSIPWTQTIYVMNAL